MITCFMFAPVQVANLLYTRNTARQNLVDFNMFDASIVFGVFDHQSDTRVPNSCSFQVSYSLVCQNGVGVPTQGLILWSVSLD